MDKPKQKLTNGIFSFKINISMRKETCWVFGYSLQQSFEIVRYARFSVINKILNVASDIAINMEM